MGFFERKCLINFYHENNSLILTYTAIQQLLNICLHASDWTCVVTCIMDTHTFSIHACISTSTREATLLPPCIVRPPNYLMLGANHLMLKYMHGAFVIISDAKMHDTIQSFPSKEPFHQNLSWLKVAGTTYVHIDGQKLVFSIHQMFQIHSQMI